MMRNQFLGVIAAALILALGGGALALAFTRSSVAPASSEAESITAAAGQSEADAARFRDSEKASETSSSLPFFRDSRRGCRCLSAH